MHDDALVLVEEIRGGGAVRLLQVTQRGWVANTGGNTLLVRENFGGTFQFDLGRHIERIESSVDGRYLAISMPGEVVVIDLLNHAITSINVASDGIGYLGFLSTDSLTAHVT